MTLPQISESTLDARLIQAWCPVPQVRISNYQQVALLDQETGWVPQPIAIT